VSPQEQSEVRDALHRGDRAEFEALVRQHQRSVFFLVMRLSRGDEELARDMVQKSFLKAWSHRESFRGESSFKSWLLRIAHNLALNELNRAWRRRELALEPTDGGSPAPLGHVEAEALDDLELAQHQALLQEAVASLSERQRAVAILRIYHDLPFAEIAAICEITTNNAKVNFHHAVSNIRTFLSNKGVAA